MNRVRHYLNEAPDSHVPLGELGENNYRSIPIVILGGVTDDDMTNLIDRIEPIRPRMFIAEVVSFADSMPTEDIERALLRLAAHMHLAALPRQSAQDLPGTWFFVTIWKGVDERHRSLIEGLLNLHLTSAPAGRMKVTRKNDLARSVRSTRESAPRSLEDARNFLDRHRAEIVTSAYERLAPPSERERNEEKAVRAIRGLVARGASRQTVRRHLRTYGYLDQNRTPGRWSDDRVKSLMLVEEGS